MDAWTASNIISLAAYFRLRHCSNVTGVVMETSVPGQARTGAGTGWPHKPRPVHRKRQHPLLPFGTRPGNPGRKRTGAHGPCSARWGLGKGKPPKFSPRGTAQLTHLGRLRLIVDRCSKSPSLSSRRSRQDARERAVAAGDPVRKGRSAWQRRRRPPRQPPEPQSRRPWPNGRPAARARIGVCPKSR